MRKVYSFLFFSFLLFSASQSWAQQLDTIRQINFVAVLSPEPLSTVFEFGDQNFGSAAFGDDLRNTAIIGEVKFADTDTLFCMDDGTDFTGKIALIPRGNCEFSVKALGAQNKGAIGVIIVNLPGAAPFNMAVGTAGAQVTIPTIMITETLGTAMKTAMQNGEAVVVSMGDWVSGFKLIEGAVHQDDNANCTFDAGEKTAPNWRVAVQNSLGSTAIRSTNAAGYYRCFVKPGYAPYLVTVLPPNGLWTACPQDITISTSNPDTVQADFAIQPNFECPLLETSISTPLLRRCFDNTFYVNICNNGTATAAGAYAEITMAAEIDPISTSNLPFTALSGGVYRFDLGDLDPLQCINIQFNATVSCDSTIIGQTLCYSAHAFPDSSCVSNLQGWNGASVNVSGVCTGNQLEFELKNTGNADMATTGNYIIIQDDIMYMSAPFQLNQGQSMPIQVPADGSTWRLEATQVPNHPVNSNPAKTIEGCTTVPGSFTTGFAMMFPVYDPGTAYDEECREIVGSFDPNDKQGFPKGFGADRLIRPGTSLEYVIRFQNTGTDTAFTVLLRDTLPSALDPMHIRNITSSHPYTMEIDENRELLFRFDDILLVDSITNEPASHGFVAFMVDQKPGNPFGTQIDNQAGIYFDFNPPVITNLTHHEVGDVLTVVPVIDLPEVLVPVVYPNPAAASTMLQLEGANFDQAAWNLYDLSGKLLASGTVSGNAVKLPGLSATGMHLLEVQAKDHQRYLVRIMLR